MWDSILCSVKAAKMEKTEHIPPRHVCIYRENKQWTDKVLPCIKDIWEMLKENFLFFSCLYLPSLLISETQQNIGTMSNY